MQMPGMWEMIIILAIVLVIFGGGKIAGVGHSLGTAIRDFKAALRAPEEEEPKASKKESTGTTE